MGKRILFILNQQVGLPSNHEENMELVQQVHDFCEANQIEHDDLVMMEGYADFGAPKYHWIEDIKQWPADRWYKRYNTRVSHLAQRERENFGIAGNKKDGEWHGDEGKAWASVKHGLTERGIKPEEVREIVYCTRINFIDQAIAEDFPGTKVLLATTGDHKEEQLRGWTPEYLESYHIAGWRIENLADCLEILKSEKYRDALEQKLGQAKTGRPASTKHM